VVENDINSFDSSLADVVLPVNVSVRAHVKTVRPEQADLPVVVEATGIINFDPAGIKTVSARFAGYVERSLVKYQYQYVARKQKIYEIYSPDIYTERWNYVKLILAFPDRDDLTKEGLEWLNLLGLSQGQIDSLKKAKIPDYHLPVYCNEEGYAVSLDFDPVISENNDYSGSGGSGFNDGITVKKGDPLFRLADARAIRIDLNVKPEDASLISSGQAVIFTDPDNPGKEYRAMTGLIEPFNSGLFQTVRVCFRIPPNEKPLARGKKISARIIAGSHDGLWLPASAIAETGRHRSVFIRRDDRFEAVEVRTGIRFKDKIEILYGIEPGSEVAEKALLLIDSDSFISME
jgi:Cu(I)/Ag(I) efflux system membrane fusion protein